MLINELSCPCLTCSVKICQVGISEVVYSMGYSVDSKANAVFAEAGVRLRQFSPVMCSSSQLCVILINFTASRWISRSEFRVWQAHTAWINQQECLPRNPDSLREQLEVEFKICWGKESPMIQTGRVQKIAITETSNIIRLKASRKDYWATSVILKFFSVDQAKVVHLSVHESI